MKIKKNDFCKFFSNLKYTLICGGAMQLVAYGAQDIYLTGNPQITFFKLSTADTLTLQLTIQQTFNVTPITATAAP